MSQLLLREDLERDLAVEPLLDGDEDDSHPPLTELVLEEVLAESLALEGHSAKHSTESPGGPEPLGLARSRRLGTAEMAPHVDPRSLSKSPGLPRSESLDRL